MATYKQNKLLACFFIAPQLIVTFFFFIWPAGKSLIQSFYFSDSFGLHYQFAGVTNFLELMTDSTYSKAILVTFIITILITCLVMFFGMFIAALVVTRKRTAAIYKSIFLWPYAVAPAIAAILWRFLYQPSIGWVAIFLNKCGYEFNYLIHPVQAVTVIVLTACWQQFSYNFLFYFAALKAIPPSLIEAATLDGASAWQRYRHIIFPLLSPTTFFLLAMNLIYALFDTFGIIDVLTHGGPQNSTTTLIYKVYKDGFIGMDPGSSAAQSVLLMFAVSGIMLFQFGYIDRKVHYI